MQRLMNINGAVIQTMQQGFLLGSRTVITATGSSTYTTPTGCQLLLVECVGGGGGGSTTANASAAQIAYGSGGNGGGYSTDVVPTVSGRTFAAVVNAGGAANTTGGVTTFASSATLGATYVSALGGGQGSNAASGTAEAFNGPGAVVAGTAVGQFTTTVAPAPISHRVSGTVAWAGPGGPGPMMTGIPNGRITQGTGAAGGKYGAGGAGGLSINAGGAGTGGHGGQGVIIVWEFY